MESVYPAGMLDRDQRTAKIRLCQCRCSDMEVPNRTTSFTTDASTKISSIFSSIVFNKKRTKFSYLIWKKGYLIHTYNFPRVKNVVLVLVYLTLTMMNPASTAPAHDEVQEDKWWEKPCGSVEPSDPLPTSPPEIFFKWHLSDLLVQAEYNLIQANHLKDSFAFYTIGNAFDYRDNPQWSYPWLENRARTKYLKGDQEAFYTVSKGFGHPSVTTTEYPWLKSSFNVRLIQGIHTGREIMRDLYRSAQAVGYAIHVMENLNEDDPIGDVFTEMKHFHKLLLAEMCDYLDLRKMEPYPYVHLDEPVEWKEPKYKSYKPLWNSTVFRACMDFYWFLWEYLRFHRQTCWEVHNEELRATPSQVDYETYITQKVKELQGL